MTLQKRPCGQRKNEHQKTRPMDAEKFKKRMAGSKEKIRQRMIDVARDKTTISYSELFGEYGFDHNDSVHRVIAGDVLCKIGAEEHAAGRPLLSVVVCQKEEKKPGDGFFALASDLGCPINRESSEEDKDSFFICTLNEAHSYWAQPKP